MSMILQPDSTLGALTLFMKKIKNQTIFQTNGKIMRHNSKFRITELARVCCIGKRSPFGNKFVSVMNFSMLNLICQKCMI